MDPDLGGPAQPPQLFPDAVRAPSLPSPICWATGHRLRPSQGPSVKNDGSTEDRPERQGSYQAVERPSVPFDSPLILQLWILGHASRAMSLSIPV